MEHHVPWTITGGNLDAADLVDGQVCHPIRVSRCCRRQDRRHRVGVLRDQQWLDGREKRLVGRYWVRSLGIEAFERARSFFRREFQTDRRTSSYTMRRRLRNCGAARKHGKPRSHSVAGSRPEKGCHRTRNQGRGFAPDPRSLLPPRTAEIHPVPRPDTKDSTRRGSDEIVPSSRSSNPTRTSRRRCRTRWGRRARVASTPQQAPLFRLNLSPPALKLNQAFISPICRINS